MRFLRNSHFSVIFRLLIFIKRILIKKTVPHATNAEEQKQYVPLRFSNHKNFRELWAILGPNKVFFLDFGPNGPKTYKFPSLQKSAKENSSTLLNTNYTPIRWKVKANGDDLYDFKAPLGHPPSQIPAIPTPLARAGPNAQRPQNLTARARAAEKPEYVVLSTARRRNESKKIHPYTPAP